jgi:hypothetical protein
MTICISIKVPDGLVLAADSMSSYTVMNPATQSWDVVQSYSYANKVIQLGSASIGALVWGQGSLQGRSMQNLLEQFSKEISGAEEPLNIAATATTLAGFIRTIYEQEFPDAQKRPVLGFLIGGYDDSSPFAQEWGFEFPGTPNPQEILPPSAKKPVFGVNWFGQTDALIRLMLGFDQRVIQGLKDKGLDSAKIDEFFSVQNLWSSKIPYEVIFDGMPLQDAVDYAAYLVHVVKGRFRFVVGPKVCGGPVDIAVVKPGKFEWVRRKALSHEHEI